MAEQDGGQPKPQDLKPGETTRSKETLGKVIKTTIAIPGTPDARLSNDANREGGLKKVRESLKELTDPFHLFHETSVDAPKPASSTQAPRTGESKFKTYLKEVAE